MVLLNAQGLALHYLGRFEEAEAVYRYAMEIGADLTTEQAWLYPLNNLGILLEESDRLEEAEKVLLEALERRRRLLGDSHDETIESMRNLANVYRKQGRAQEEQALTGELRPSPGVPD